MIFMDTSGVRRIESYFARIGAVLGSAKRRASFAVYAMGLFGGAERKSVEPMAALACRSPKKMDAAHQRLLHSVSCSPWSDREVRLGIRFLYSCAGPKRDGFRGDRKNAVGEGTPSHVSRAFL